MYQKHKPNKIIHLAAKVGGIRYNIEHPAEMLHQNIMINSNVIHYAYKYNVEKLLATLSNCAYPDTSDIYPMKENVFHNDLPTKTNLAYGYSKRVMDIQIKSYRDQYNNNFISVIPCSIYGPNDNFEEGKSHFLAALIKKIYYANKRDDDTLNLFGTGRPLRQYIFSEDVAKLILILLEKYDDSEPINIATNENYSIKKIAETAVKATGSTLKIKFDKKFPDGQYRKDISNNKLFNIVGNFGFITLREGIKKTYTWFKEKEELK